MKNLLLKSIVPGTKVQVCTLSHVLFSLHNETELAALPPLSTTENLYWVGGVGLDVQGRVSDADIVAKNYFFLDFDIRQKNPGITDEEIIKSWDWIKEGLEGWEYCVFSGNGLHVYFFLDEPITDAALYSSAVRELAVQAGVDTLCSKEIDLGCTNISRLARLPGTVNQKTGRSSFILDTRP